MDHAAQLMVPALVPVIGPMGAGQADEHVRQGFGDQCPVGGRVAGARMRDHEIRWLCNLIKMKWSDYDGEGIYVVRFKTSTRVWIPLHEQERQLLDTMPRHNAGTILTRADDGQPLYA
ncbi:hypothetical protein Geu3261_0020_022 [Komagataeibacter europaeus NBRC 3261]|uniref:Integrase n=1 Tax=Komagataeibacter europaeus NBRC 3261 TaxID=1234669 RepID=A0A0D6PW10_KOMEU|nr:hypothetical protein Geu3261_0020_022 [Komagataeibacter europaeus NBRC 3261]